MPQRLSEPQRLLLEHLKGIIYQGRQPILRTDYYWTRRLAEITGIPENKLLEVIGDYAKKKQKLLNLYQGTNSVWELSINQRAFSEREKIYLQARIERLGAALVKAKIGTFEKLGVTTPYSLEAELKNLVAQVKKLNQKEIGLRQKKATKKQGRRRSGKP